MGSNVIVLVVSQALFTASDLLARNYMPVAGFKTEAFLSWWFLGYVLIRVPATFGQLYIFTTTDLHRTMTLFAVAGIILANTLGVLVFRETITGWQYFGISLAVVAFLLVGFSEA